MSLNEASVVIGTGESGYSPASVHDGRGEQALVAAAQTGATDAMNELLVKHKRAMYRAARRFTRTHEEAEDLVQDAMLRAFANVRKFRNESRFSTWLIAIVNNAALSMKRKGRNTFFVSLDGGPEEQDGHGRWDIADLRRDPEQETMRQELMVLLHNILLRQSRTEQIILERSVFDEARISETALSLGLTIGSVKSSLYRARRKLSDSFERRGLIKRRKLPTMRAQ